MIAIAFGLASARRWRRSEIRSEISPDRIPEIYIPVIEKGAKEALEYGDLMGYPVTDVEVIFTGGAFRDSQGTELAYKVAAAMACREASCATTWAA